MLFDLHNDIIWECIPRSEKYRYIIDNSDKKIILAFWTTDKKYDIMEEIDCDIKNFSIYKNIFFAIEDLHFVNSENLDRVLRFPLTYCTPAWKHDNNIAGGHKGKSGVSKWGKEVLQKLCNNNIAIDTAHLNEKSFYEVLDNCKFVLNSHTCMQSVYSHTRNLSDAQIKSLILHDGIIALSTVAEFMSDKEACRQHFLKQILCFLEKFGDNNLCIGTDFFGAPKLKGLCEYIHFEMLRQELKHYGISDKTIDKIYFLNAQKYFQKLKLGEKYDL